MENILNIKSFGELYKWFEKNFNNEEFIWVNAKRGKPNDKDFNYLDAVYCALCFGWIDSTCKNVDGATYQKFTPRSKNSHWTYLNIARCEYLISQGLMTKYGIKVMPKKYKKFKVGDDIIKFLKRDKNAWNNFQNFPKLYQRICLDNIEWARNDKNLFTKRLNKLYETSKNNKMYGQWNDYGRL